MKASLNARARARKSCLAQHEQRRAVLALQLADRQPLDGELAVVVARNTARPQRFVEGIEVGGDLEPVRGERGLS